MNHFGSFTWLIYFEKETVNVLLFTYSLWIVILVHQNNHTKNGLITQLFYFCNNYFLRYGTVLSYIFSWRYIYKFKTDFFNLCNGKYHQKKFTFIFIWKLFLSTGCQTIFLCGLKSRHFSLPYYPLYLLNARLKRVSDWHAIVETFM